MWSGVDQARSRLRRIYRASPHLFEVPIEPKRIEDVAGTAELITSRLEFSELRTDEIETSVSDASGAQEYEAKINSGDIVSIAEVVRDLYRSESQPEQSYSERQLYEAALDRLSREIAAVQRGTETEAVKEIEAALAKGPRRGPKPAEEDDVVEEEAA
jgi:RNA polymerase-interacting CarD/CdnL/TRCF family regulator